MGWWLGGVGVQNWLIVGITFWGEKGGKWANCSQTRGCKINSLWGLCFGGKKGENRTIALRRGDAK